MPTESNRPWHTFNQGTWLWDGKFTVYYDNSTNVAGHVYFMTVPVTYENTKEVITRTSRNVCEVYDINKTLYVNDAVRYCEDLMVKSCDDIDARIHTLKTLIARLENSKYDRKVYDSVSDMNRESMTKYIEIAVYVPVTIVNKTEYVTNTVEVIKYRLPQTGWSL